MAPLHALVLPAPLPLAQIAAIGVGLKDEICSHGFGTADAVEPSQVAGVQGLLGKEVQAMSR